MECNSSELTSAKLLWRKRGQACTPTVSVKLSQQNACASSSTSACASATCSAIAWSAIVRASGVLSSVSDTDACSEIVAVFLSATYALSDANRLTAARRAHVDSVQGGSGAVFSLLPPENATGNYVKVVQRIPVKLVLERGENARHLLVPGMSVVPTIALR